MGVATAVIGMIYQEIPGVQGSNIAKRPGELNGREVVVLPVIIDHGEQRLLGLTDAKVGRNRFSLLYSGLTG